jgi:hypothetical protein
MEYCKNFYLKYKVWRAVPCGFTTQQPIQWKFQGSNTYYIKIQASQINVPVTMIQYNDGGTWKNLQRTSDNFFISSGNINFPMNFPIQVRAISYDGQTITNTIQSLVNNQLIPGSGQFNGTGGPTNPQPMPSQKPNNPSRNSTNSRVRSSSSKLRYISLFLAALHFLIVF